MLSPCYVGTPRTTCAPLSINDTMLWSHSTSRTRRSRASSPVRLRWRAGKSPWITAKLSPKIGRASRRQGDPLRLPIRWGSLHLSHELKANQRASFYFTITFSANGKRDALRELKNLPPAADALRATQKYYHEILNRSVVLTPDRQVNRGVFWAKANMLRTMLLAPTGWCFVNDPSRSNNSVARDTAWFAFGADYIVPEFAEESLLWYAEHLERRGMVIEYYDIRNGKAADYKLNINDNTPLLILALWHHYNTTQNRAFLERIYPAARKAAAYLLSQRNEQGLVWCTATGTSDWGIVGWRNVIQNYRLSGATTEVNSECYAALQTMSHMARVLGKHEREQKFKSEAEALRAAINTHLFNKKTGLYYLNIDIDGVPRTDVTSDLVFPVMFGVADAKRPRELSAVSARRNSGRKPASTRCRVTRSTTDRFTAMACLAESGSVPPFGTLLRPPSSTPVSWRNRSRGALPTTPRIRAAIIRYRDSFPNGCTARRSLIKV